MHFSRLTVCDVDKKKPYLICNHFTTEMIYFLYCNNLTTDSLLWAFHPLRAFCFSVSPFLSPATSLWSVGYSCCVRATGGNNDFSPGQSRNQAALATEQVVKLSQVISLMTLLTVGINRFKKKKRSFFKRVNVGS